MLLEYFKNTLQISICIVDQSIWNFSSQCFHYFTGVVGKEPGLLGAMHLYLLSGSVQSNHEK